jgi:hypothetical protein
VVDQPAAVDGDAKVEAQVVVADAIVGARRKAFARSALCRRAFDGIQPSSANAADLVFLGDRVFK